MEPNGQKRKAIEEFEFIEDIQSDNNSISSTNICKTTIFRIILVTRKNIRFNVHITNSYCDLILFMKNRL